MKASTKNEIRKIIKAIQQSKNILVRNEDYETASVVRSFEEKLLLLLKPTTYKPEWDEKAWKKSFMEIINNWQKSKTVKKTKT